MSLDLLIIPVVLSCVHNLDLNCNVFIKLDNIIRFYIFGINQSDYSLNTPLTLETITIAIRSFFLNRRQHPR